MLALGISSSLLTHQTERGSFTQPAEATDLGVQDLGSQSCQLMLRASLERDEGLERQSCANRSGQSRAPVTGPVAENKTQGRG